MPVQPLVLSRKLDPETKGPAVHVAAAGPDRINLSRPLVLVPLAAKALKVSPQAVEGMLKELGTVRAIHRTWARPGLGNPLGERLGLT